MRPHRGFLLAGLVLLCGVPASLPAQMEANRMIYERDESAVFVDAVSFASPTSPDSSRLAVFMQVGFSMLTFVKNGDSYEASYEMTLSLLDSTETLIQERLWTETLRGIPFERTGSSSAVNVSQRSLAVKPGRYTLRLVFRDKESGASRTVPIGLVVPNYAAGDFALSGIMLLNRVNTVGDKRSITPSVSSNIGAIPDSFFVYLEAYNRRSLDSVQLVTSITSTKTRKSVSFDTVAVLRPGRSEQILCVPHGALPIGDYVLTIVALPIGAAYDDQKQVLASTSRPVVVRWYGLPRSVVDLDLAIDQLKYIAKDNEMSTLEEAKTPEEKMAAFNEFWRKRDPNPSTPRNERMEEYYGRVEYANKHFSHYIDGWRTDRGMVFIMFGPPSSIDRHPFDVDSKPYEVWSYYELNYSFVFVDQTGFGDYRLETPLWEVWNRMRN